MKKIKERIFNYGSRVGGGRRRRRRRKRRRKRRRRKEKKKRRRRRRNKRIIMNEVIRNPRKIDRNIPNCKSYR